MKPICSCMVKAASPRSQASNFELNAVPAGEASKAEMLRAMRSYSRRTRSRSCSDRGSVI